MNGIPWVNFTNLEIWLMITKGGTLFTLFLIVFIYERSMQKAKKKNQSFLAANQLRKWAKECETLCLNLSQNLEEKKVLSQRLMEKLDEKIQSLNLHLEGSEEKKKSTDQEIREPDPYGKVEKMVNAGYKFSEITRSLKLPKGEVQLILDLKQYSQ